MKNNPITIGFDDAKFKFKTQTKTTQLIGVVCQKTRMVSVVKKEIIIDGEDATDALIDLVKQNEKHVQYVLTDTITFGGFNVVDLDAVYKAVRKPIVAITDKEVDLESVVNAIKKNFPATYKTKLDNITKAGNLFESEIKTAGGTSKIFFHAKGIAPVEVELLLKKICIDSKLPEPIRLAHLIGTLF